MGTQPAPDEITGDQRIERRRQTRDPNAPPDWEQIVLQRMANRVRSLSGGSSPDAQQDARDRWEDAALRTLQRRIDELDDGG